MTLIRQLFRVLASGIVFAATGIVAAGGRNADAQGGTPLVPAPSNAAHAAFVPNTLIPRLAMGVRRGVADPRDVAELRDRPGGTIVERVSLFSPMYVHGEQRVGSEDWVLLARGYTGKEAALRGWIPRSDIEVFSTRYGYVVNDKGNATEFFQTPGEAYAIVPGMGRKDEATPSPAASVLGRADTTDWRPLRQTDQMPFMELEFDKQSGYPSTTPSTATPYDGRLVRVGAICGGPVDEAVLGKLRSEADRNAAVEMLFVVDETWSMKEFFAGVAAFIGDVGQAAGGGMAQRPRIAVSYYTDGPPGKRTTCVPLQEVTQQVVTALAESVKNHKQQMPPGDYDNPPERMLDGMRDAITKAGFTEGVTSIVVVIGDTGHEPGDPGKQELLDDVAGLIADRGLMVFFVHVGLKGDEMSPDQNLFKKDAEAVRQRVGQRKKGFADRVRYITANASNLTAELKASRREADRLAEQARLMTGRITSRNTHTMPGPALVTEMTKKGVTLAEFNESHQQIYVPSCVWMVSPRDAAGKGKQAARLGRCFCMAPEELAAVIALLESVSKDVDAGVAIDHDKAVLAFTKSLGAATKDTASVQAVQATWMNEGQARTAGTFLDRFVGLNLREEVLFSRVPLGDTQESADAKKSFAGTVKALEEASRVEGRFWFEVSAGR